MNAAPRLRLMIGSLLIFVVAVAAFNYLLNPYGAWRTSTVDPIFRRVDRERITTPYLLRTARPTTLLIGTSRVFFGIPVEQGWRGQVQNAALSGASLSETSAELDLAMENPQLTRVVWGLDFFAFDGASLDQMDPITRRRLDGDTGALISDTLLSFDAFQDSRQLLSRALSGRRKLPAQRLGPVPWTPDEIRMMLASSGQKGLDRESLAQDVFQVSHYLPDYSGYRFEQRQLAACQRIIGRLRARGLRLILFLPPLSEYELELIRQTGHWPDFMLWKTKLAAAAGAYTDFSGYNRLAAQEDLFLDVTHFKPVVGQVILRELLDEGCNGCGPGAEVILDARQPVDASNLQEVMAAQNEAEAAAAGADTKFARVVAQALPLMHRDATPP